MLFENTPFLAAFKLTTLAVLPPLHGVAHRRHDCEVLAIDGREEVKSKQKIAPQLWKEEKELKMVPPRSTNGVSVESCTGFFRIFFSASAFCSPPESLGSSRSASTHPLLYLTIPSSVSICSIVTGSQSAIIDFL